MTGPEHYREAERLLGVDAAGPPHSKDMPDSGRVARAQVHAALALAAATALGGGEGPPAPDWDAWYRTASEGPGAKRRRVEAEFAKDAQS